jgi:hypothetical protein
VKQQFDMHWISNSGGVEQWSFFAAAVVAAVVAAVAVVAAPVAQCPACHAI